MLLLLGEALSFSRVSRALPDSAFWGFLAHHQSHVEWQGCSLHDLIQPSFSFLVGVALPFSLASRALLGQSLLRRTLHAALRAFILIFLGIFLRSMGRSQTYFTFEDTLTQIGLGYFFLYLLGCASRRTQWIALGGILVGYWGAFALYPAPGPDFDWGAVGVGSDWQHLSGFAAHWDKNSNLAWAFDTWFLNLFPRESPFKFNGGGYATLSFIPTLGTMLLGLIAGSWLRSSASAARRSAQLALVGATGIGLGLLLDVTGICPNVKRIWTPAWTLFSGGWCFIGLAVFHLLVDGWRLGPVFFPLTVMGRNSILAYLMEWLCVGFVGAALTRHFGEAPFQVLGAAYEPLLRGATTLAILWLCLYGLYRKRIFLRI